jgi:hypothetical protein
MTKKTICLLLAVLMLGVLLAGCKEEMTDDRIREYNTSITLAARKAGKITQQDFILIETITEGKDGHEDVTLRIYRVAEGQDADAYRNLRVSDLPEDFGPEHMGNGTARLLNGSLESIVLNLNFIR